MKKHKFMCIALCVLLTVSIFASCKPKVIPLSYSGGTLAAGTIGVAYNQSISCADDSVDAAGITYELKSGNTLPGGLTITGDKVSGTPSTVTNGEHSFIVVATSGDRTGEAEFKIVINKGDLNYAAKSLPSGKVGEAYPSQTVTATGAPSIGYALKSGNNLPEGLTLSPDGIISGTPTQKTEGPHSFTVIATATGTTAGNYNAAEQTFSIVIVGEDIQFNGGTLANAKVGVSYSGRVEANTGSATAVYTMKAGNNLPSGLQLNSSGTITGTPENVTSNAHSFTVVVTASGFDNPAEATFEITVDKGDLHLTGAILDEGTLGDPYEYRFTATGALSSVIINYTEKTSGSLPPGLSLSPNGLLNGTPTTATNSNQSFIIVATATGGNANNYNAAEATFSIPRIKYPDDYVEPGEIRNFTPQTLAVAVVGSTYSVSIKPAAITATNGRPISFALKAGSVLPEGFVLSSGGMLSFDGLVAGAADSYQFTVVASAEQCDPVEAVFTLTISNQKVPFNLPDNGYEISLNDDLIAAVGEQFNYDFTWAVTQISGVTHTYTIHPTISRPAGLSVTADGRISGIPEKSGLKEFVVVVVGAEGYVSRDLWIEIKIKGPLTVVANGIFQAELATLDGIQGAGISNNPIGADMIQVKEEVFLPNDGPDDVFVGYTFCPLIIPFEIYSSTAVTGASFAISLASEGGDLTFINSGFVVRVNGHALPYDSFEIDGTSGSGGQHNYSLFQEKTLSEPINLVAGLNVIELEIRGSFFDAQQVGPGIDYIKIGNIGGATLSWHPAIYQYDLISRGG